MNWLLLRGLGRVREHWLNFPDRLKVNQNIVECLDLPGFGQFAHVDPPFTIHRHTDFLRAEFKSLQESTSPKKQRKHRWTLVGLSLGGMVALDWAHRYPDDFEKLVIINTSARDLATWLQRFSLSAFYRVGRAISAPTVSAREREILRLISNSKSRDKKVLHRLTSIAQTHPLDRASLARQLAAAARFKCPGKIEIPTLIVTSLKDRIVDSRCSKAIGERLGSIAQMKFHSTAGHDLPLDDPKWLATQLLEFVR